MATQTLGARRRAGARSMRAIISTRSPIRAALAAKGVRVITRAEGCWLWDSEGNRILDGMAGLWCVNVGYGRVELVEAARRQMTTLPFYNTFFQCTTAPAVELAARLAALAPAGLSRVFFANPAPRPTTRWSSWCATSGSCRASRTSRS